MKLTSKDLVILGEGAQLKKLIESVYSSIERFLEVHPIYELGTLKHRLKKRIIDNENIKVKLVKIFDLNYDEIYLTPDKQIQKYIDIMENEIKLYDAEEDLNLVNELLKLANEYNRELAYNCYYIKALIHINLGQISNAINCLNISAQKPTLYHKSILELGFCNFLEKQYKEAEQYYAELIANPNGCDQFLLYYRYGLLLNNTDRNMQAVQMYTKAIETTGERRKQGKALMNIAVAYYKVHMYQKAIKIYEESLNYFESKHDKAIVYNNIAHVHESTYNYKLAYEYSEMAIANVNPDNKKIYFSLFFANCRMNILYKNECSNGDKLIALIKEMANKLIYKQYITDCVQYLIDHANFERLKKIETLLLEMLNNPSYASIKTDCKAFLYDIMIKERSESIGKS